MAGEPRRLGKYEVWEELGRGKTATVYRAVDTTTQREVALKLFHGQHGDDQDFVIRFQEEARIAAGLHHPRLITVYEFGEIDGYVYVTTRLISGRTLRHWLDEQKRLTLDQALPILRQIAEGIGHLQGQGLIHRDLKPENILLEGQPNAFKVTLVDFGLAQTLQHSTHFTSVVDGIGTPHYLAPEQADSKRWGEITPLCDVYALGVVGYEMLTGQLPYDGDSIVSLMLAHASAQPLHPLTAYPELGLDLADVLLNGLEKAPSQRTQTGLAWVGKLAEVKDARRLASEHPATLVELVAQAETARQAEDWDTLLEVSVLIMSVDRNHSHVLGWIGEAQQGIEQERAEEMTRKKCAELYEAGIRAVEIGAWQDAFNHFSAVAEQDGDYQDVQSQIIISEAQVRKAEWLGDSERLGEQKKWAHALHILVKLLQEDWSYQEGQGVKKAILILNEFLPPYNAFLEQESSSEEISSPYRLTEGGSLIIGKILFLPLSRKIEPNSQIQIKIFLTTQLARDIYGNHQHIVQIGFVGGGRISNGESPSSETINLILEDRVGEFIYHAGPEPSKKVIFFARAYGFEETIFLLE